MEILVAAMSNSWALLNYNFTITYLTSSYTMSFLDIIITSFVLTLVISFVAKLFK